MGSSNTTRTILLLVALLGAIGLAGYSMRRERASATALAAAKKKSLGAAADPANPAVIRFVKDPEQAPITQAKDIDGKAVSLDAYKGKVVIVNFWATWCPPCREEIPEMIALQSEFKDQLQIVGISEDEDGPEKVRKFAQAKGMNYPVVMATNDIIGAWGGVPALPTSFVLDPQGRVVTKHMGLKDSDTYEREIRALLGTHVDAKVELVADTGQVFMRNAAHATELPDVDFTGLTPEQKKTALHRLNAEACNCGCGLTLSECRINDDTCPVSKQLAADVVKQVRTGTSPKSTAAKPDTTKATPADSPQKQL